MADDRYVGDVVVPPTSGSRPSLISPRILFGAAMVVVGTLWTLDGLDLIESEPIIDWWPVLLVAFGLGRMFGIGTDRQWPSGAVFTLVGSLLLLNRVYDLPFEPWKLWPMWLVIAGASILFRSWNAPAGGIDRTDRAALIRPVAFWAGVTVRNTSENFRGGEATAIMGGVDLDLRGSRTTQPQVIIDATAIMGGVEIIVPRDWRVVNEVMAVMGGVEDKTRPALGPPRTTLILRGFAFWGGIEVKHGKEWDESEGTRRPDDAENA